jgi:hypothetical protein
VRQLQNFPLGDHNDGPDALALRTMIELWNERIEASAGHVTRLLSRGPVNWFAAGSSPFRGANSIGTNFSYRGVNEERRDMSIPAFCFCRLSCEGFDVPSGATKLSVLPESDWGAIGTPRVPFAT